MEDARIISLFFARDQQAIAELDSKYGGVCRERGGFEGDGLRRNRAAVSARTFESAEIEGDGLRRLPRTRRV